MDSISAMDRAHRIAYLGIMIASVTVATLLSRRLQGARGLSRTERITIAIGALAGGTLAAKLPFFIADPHGFASGRAWLESGRTLTLGLVGGYFGVEAAKLAMGIKRKTGDGFVIPVAAGVAIGRLGCFVAGCCYGTPTSLPWATDFGDHVPRHPTQLYELAFHASAVAFFAYAARRNLFPRQRIKIYIIAYFLYRFFTEWIRPEPRGFASLTFYQWTAIVFVPVFAWLYVRDARNTSSGDGATAATTAASSTGER